MGGLEVSLPPQDPQHLLFQHGFHLHAPLQLLQPLGVFAHVKALDFLVSALHLLQGAVAGDDRASRARARRQAVALQVEPQAAQVDVVAMAVGAFVWTLAGVQALVELEVDKLGELCRAELAVVRLLPRVKAQVSFQVAGAAEAFVTNLEETEQKLESATCNNIQRGGPATAQRKGLRRTWHSCGFSPVWTR